MQREEVEIRFSQAPDLEKMFESECYRALQQIKEILEDDRLNDRECFMKIEEIVALFDAYGGCEGRHDWG